MKYVYDILLNFHSCYFEFFDWNIDDKILHIKKIPIFGVRQKDLYNILNNEVSFEQNFLEKIKDKTEFFVKDDIKVCSYSVLLYTLNKVIALKVSKSGKVIAYSSLLIDEEYEILKEMEKIPNDEFIKYKIKKMCLKRINGTRNSLKIQKNIENRISDSSTEKLQYILYVLTNDEVNNREQIIKMLYKKITEYKNEMFNLLN